MKLFTTMMLRYIAAQFVEAHRLEFHQAVENDHFVFAVNQGQGVAEAGAFKIGLVNVVFDHKLTTFFKDSTCRKRQYLSKFLYALQL